MGPHTFLRVHKKAVGSALLMMRWTLVFCLHRDIHPIQRPHLHTIIQLHHHTLPTSQRHPARSVGGCWHAPALVLLRLPLSHTKVAPVPLAFTEMMLNDTSLPLPLLLWISCCLLQLSESLWDLPSDFVAHWAVVEPMLLCAFLHMASLTLTDIRPTNIE